jgi:hypothetical protein
VSQFSEIMETLEAQNVQMEWLVTAVKRLLLAQAPAQPEINRDQLELDLDDDFDAEYAAAAAAVVPGNAGCGHVLTAIRGGHVVCAQCGNDLGCAHNQQALVNGRVVCGGCGAVLGQSGVVGRDPNAPLAGSQTHEASSRNNGTPLVPYS